MPTVQRTSRANDDRVAIALHIAQANPTAANIWLDTIEQKCRLLATMPEMGRLRSELATNIGSWAVGESVIFYQPVPDGIIVVRVLQGSRDLPPRSTS
jgi:toxin ParE1/3/4